MLSKINFQRELRAAGNCSIADRTPRAPAPPPDRETVTRIGNARSNLTRPDKLPTTNLPARRRVLLLAASLSCLFAFHANADSDKAMDVAVRIQGDEVIADLNFHVRVTPQEAWTVMTDYDHATHFISKLEKSVVLSRTDERLLVSQKGTMGYGPFSLSIETVSEIRLTPYEKMQARLVSGNMKKNDATTRLIPDASGTRIVHHMESIPDVWIPPIIGRALVEFEMRARFRQLAEEMLRRKALSEGKR
jgi:hypothetical protein